MTRGTPLIRYGSILPIVRWMQANGRPVEDNLRAVNLAYVLNGVPTLPIALTHALAFLRNASDAEGPDFLVRVVSGESVAELGLIGRIALGGGSVRSALFRVAEAIPAQISHYTIMARAAPDGVIVRQAWHLRMEEDTRHYAQQYFAALIQALCANAGARPPVFERVALVPHPVHGLSHLQPWFGGTVEASSKKIVELMVPKRVADLVLPKSPTELEGSGGSGEYPPLYGDGKLTTLIKTILTSMLDDAAPTVERLASAAGLSVRSLQRRLGEEGASFSSLLAEVRRDLALEALSTSERKVGEIAASLGYGQHSSFTRAVRRWSGTSPRTLAERLGK
jgi:AraC-like DNA-binding protein